MWSVKTMLVVKMRCINQFMSESEKDDKGGSEEHWVVGWMNADEEWVKGGSVSESRGPWESCRPGATQGELCSLWGRGVLNCEHWTSDVGRMPARQYEAVAREAKSEVTGLAGLNLGNSVIVSSIDHQNVVNVWNY